MLILLRSRFLILIMSSKTWYVRFICIDFSCPTHFYINMTRSMEYIHDVKCIKILPTACQGDNNYSIFENGSNKYNCILYVSKDRSSSELIVNFM